MIEINLLDGLQPSDIAHIKDYFPHLTGGSKTIPKDFGNSDNDANVVFNFPYYKNEDELAKASDLIFEGEFIGKLDEQYYIDKDLIYNLYRFNSSDNIIDVKVHESFDLGLIKNTIYKLYLCEFENAPYSLINPKQGIGVVRCCLLYTSPSPRDGLLSRMPSSA